MKHTNFSRILIWGLGLLTGLSAGLLFANLYWSQGKPLAVPPKGCEINCIDAFSGNFFSDDILIFGEDEDKNALVVKLELNRKQLKDKTYVHYYTGQVVYKDLNTTLSDNFIDPNGQVEKQEIFDTYENKIFPDLSSRETYDFSFQVQGKLVKISLENLNGDFIEKNTPEYTKYLSAGQAQIMLGDKKITGQSMISKIYSTDYSKYIFFDGQDDLKAQTDYLIFWDQDNNFYLVDHTKTDTEKYNYKSHTWVLYKNASDNSLKKAFQADVEYINGKDFTAGWHLKIPDIFQTKLTFIPQQYFEGLSDEGIANGTLTSLKGTSNVQGVFKFGDYN